MYILCKTRNMGMGYLPDTFAQSLKATGSRALGIHIRLIMSTYATTVM